METIANTPNIFYVVPACVGQLLPQQFDLRLYNLIYIVGGIFVPYMVIKLFPTENLSGIAGKTKQQIKLLFGQPQVFPL